MIETLQITPDGEGGWNADGVPDDGGIYLIRAIEYMASIDGDGLWQFYQQSGYRLKITQPITATRIG